jgi:hypothetical protein
MSVKRVEQSFARNAAAAQAVEHALVKKTNHNLYKTILIFT